MAEQLRGPFEKFVDLAYSKKKKKTVAAPPQSSDSE
jgi:hypothetical protein